MINEEVVIFDLQGTLVDVSGIRHLVEGTGKKDFDAFHRATGNCPPHQYVVDAAHQARRDNREIIVMSGCGNEHREMAQSWLAHHGIEPLMLMMRPEGDYRKDFVVKREMYMTVCRLGFRPVHAWDDNPGIIELWRELGIPVTVVPGWTGG